MEQLEKPALHLHLCFLRQLVIEGFSFIIGSVLLIFFSKTRQHMLEIEKSTNASQERDSYQDHESESCFIIGISGGSGSGKTTLANNIIKRINHKDIIILSMDSYYKASCNFSVFRLF